MRTYRHDTVAGGARGSGASGACAYKAAPNQLTATNTTISNADTGAAPMELEVHEAEYAYGIALLLVSDIFVIKQAPTFRSIVSAEVAVHSVEVYPCTFADVALQDVMPAATVAPPPVTGWQPEYEVGMDEEVTLEPVPAHVMPYN